MTFLVSSNSEVKHSMHFVLYYFISNQQNFYNLRIKFLQITVNFTVDITHYVRSLININIKLIFYQFYAFIEAERLKYTTVIFEDRKNCVRVQLLKDLKANDSESMFSNNMSNF